MLHIEDFSIFVPDTYFSVNDMSFETQISKETLLIYYRIFGLDKVPIAVDLLPADLINIVLQGLLKKYNYIDVDAIFYIYTSPMISFHNTTIEKIFSDNQQISYKNFFAMNMYKCVSFLRALEVISSLIKSKSLSRVLIVTGEVAYTPKLRVVPGTTIVGDAATASLVNNWGDSHSLISISTKFIPGYSKGIYLSQSELVQFDRIFIDEISKTIKDVLDEANLTLSDIALILPHNVNIPTWEKIAMALKLPFKKIYTANIPRFSHSFCSDHVLNLHYALLEGLLLKGDYYMMVACGMGFYMGAAVFQY